MKMYRHALGAALTLVLAAALPANAQWSDNFDSYPSGANVGGLGGWAGWDGGAVNATISGAHPKYAGDLAASMTVNDDLVHTFSGLTSGQYIFTAYQFIPGNQAATANSTFFILMNKYTLSSKGWSVQMKFDYNTDLVTDDESAAKPGVPILYDTWSEIKVLIDLDANTQSTFYNGVFVGNADWYDPTSIDHLKNIGAVDLWGDLGGGGVCYDNMSLTMVPEPTSLALGLIGLGALFLRRR